MLLLLFSPGGTGGPVYAVDAWPIALPQCFIVGYNETPGDGLIETQPDIGPPITRRRSAAVTRALSGSMRMTRSQIATLRTFIDTTILGGSIPFSFKDPTSPPDTLLVKFAKGNLPTWQQTAVGVYRVNINLTVLP